MRKLNPRALKIASNEAFALKYARTKKKGSRRKTRRERTLARELAWLLSVGVDPKESEAPVG